MRPEIENLLAKKDFSKGLFKLDDTSKVKDYFATEGNLKDVTDDEVKELGTSLGNLMQNIAKLPEDKLEKIGGGVDPDPNFYDQFAVEDLDVPEIGEIDNRLQDYKGYERKRKTKAIGIGAAALGGLAAAGAGIYKIGKSRGWWDKFKRK